MPILEKYACIFKLLNSPINMIKQPNDHKAVNAFPYNIAFF